MTLIFCSLFLVRVTQLRANRNQRRKSRGVCLENSSGKLNRKKFILVAQSLLLCCFEPCTVTSPCQTVQLSASSILFRSLCLSVFPSFGMVFMFSKFTTFFCFLLFFPTFTNGLFSSSYCQILLFFSTFTFFWQTLWDNFRQVEINKTHTFLRCSLAAIWFSGFPVKLFPLLLLLLVSLLSWSFFANLVHPFSTSFYSDIFQSCAKSCQNRCGSGQNLVCFFSISSCVLLLLLPVAIFCFFCLYIVVLLPHPLAITLVLCRNFCFMISFQHTTHQYFPRLCRSWKIYFRVSSD